jgi:site-specific DNA-methyltransferase (adenine-specific)
MPEQLLGRIIRLCSNPGDLVFDPFAGSASTLIVAKKLGRRHLGCELSPDYVKAGLKRLAKTAVGEPLAGSLDATTSAPATDGPGARRAKDSARSRIAKRR